MINRLKLWVKSRIKPIEIPIYITISKEKLLEDKVTIILGGDGGIGFAIAEKFIDSGAKVIITGRNEKKLLECCKKLGKNSKYLILDLYNIKSFEEKILEAKNIFNKIDIMVDSVGMHVSRKDLDFINVSEEEYDKVMNLNLKGSYFISQKIIKYWINNNINGHLLFISSQSALEPAWSPYRLSKNGMRAITEGISQKALKYGIIVNAIGPGPTATEMQGYKDSSTIFTDDNNIGRFTLPSEIAEFAVLLCSKIGDTVVGDTIYMSGGRGIIDKR